MKMEVVESKIDIGDHPAGDWYLVRESSGKGSNLGMEVTHLDSCMRIDVIGQKMFDVLFDKMPEIKGT